jgi:tetratricopeptide (TPR) repeat protein
MLAEEWKASNLPRLSDPNNAKRTLQWLFARSVRGLDEASRCALAAAGLLAHAPFPTEAITAALGAADAMRGRDALKPLVRRGLLRSAPNGEWQFAHVLAYRFARDESGSDPALRERLAVYLRERFVPILRPGGGALIAGLGRSLEHAAALLHADSDQRLWLPLANGLLYDISDRFRELGRLDLARLALHSVADWLAQIIAAKGEEVRWQRELAVVRRKIGDVLSAHGDQKGALAFLRESLELRRRLAQSDRTNTAWQRDLSVSLNRVGDVLSQQGDQRGALALFEESLDLIRRLAESDPTNAQWQRDLGASLENVGDVLSRQGDQRGALALFRESLELSRRLAESDRTNADWQRDLSVSLNWLGGVLSHQGDQPGALALFRESLELRRRLAESDRSNADWQRDLSVSLNKVGGVLSQQGDETGALALFRESLELRRRLTESDPTNAEWQRDLSFVLARIAEISFGEGDRAEALRLAEESLGIDERLAALDPTNAMWQKDVRVSRALVARLRGEGE